MEFFLQATDPILGKASKPPAIKSSQFCLYFPFVIYIECLKRRVWGTNPKVP